MGDWYRLETADVLTRLDTDPQKGLATNEVERRLAQYSLNASLVQASREQIL